MDSTVGKELSNSALIGIEAIQCEADGLLEVAETLKTDSSNFIEAVTRIYQCTGRVIICGMGKSGIVGNKIAASLASTGTPAFSLHPGEAFHGDLGMIKSNDIFIALSNSGETEEVLKLLPFLEGNGNVIISLTKNHSNTLAKASTVSLRTGVSKEACPLQLAPTSSTTAAMAMGDALVVALVKVRKFQPEDFARFHPGGSLGRKLVRKVKDVMTSNDLPFVEMNSTLDEVMTSIMNSGLGLTLIGTPTDLVGILTDGDIRRYLANEDVSDEGTLYGYMTRKPVCCNSNIHFGTAMEIMEEKKLTSLIVIDSGLVVGVVKK